MNKPKILEWICIGIVYTIYLWPLVNTILIIFLVVFWLLFMRKEFFRPSASLGTGSGRGVNTLLFLFTALYLVSVLGFLYTENKDEGLFKLQQQSAILFFPLVFGTIAVPEGFFKKISFHFILATCVAAFISIVSGLVNFSITGDASMLAKENLMLFRDLNPPMTGVLCITAIIILLTHYFKDFKNKKLAFFAVTFLSAYIILLSVRLEIVFLLIILLVFIFKLIGSALHRAALALLMLVVIVVSVISIPILNRQWKELIDFSPQNHIVLDQDSSLGKNWGGKSIRLAIWDCSRDILKEHWLLGVGTGDVQDSLQATYDRRQFYFASKYNRYNAHNQYLEIWLANGVAGLIIYISCLLIPLMIFLKRRDSFGYVLFLGLVIAMSFTESFLNVNKGVIWYSFFNSIFAFHRRDAENKS
ncbi:MAG TPA: O-antigen ligase family protein [Chitinophagaceae bacterium]|nr:O-antigen ligase family protein [Chitinophagaceae bacterium]